MKVRLACGFATDPTLYLDVELPAVPSVGDWIFPKPDLLYFIRGDRQAEFHRDGVVIYVNASRRVTREDLYLDGWKNYT